MTCTNCDSQTAAGVMLCHACTTSLETILDQIPDALAEAETTVAKLDKVSRGLAPTPNSEPKAPINFDASEYARDLREKVHSWARMTLEHDGDMALRNVEPLTYLKMSVHIIRTNDWAGDLVDELDDALREVSRAVDLPPDVMQFGACGTTDCTGIIRGRKGERLAKCRDCNTQYDANHLQTEAISEAWEHRATLTTVVRALNQAEHPVRQATARKWVERGKLVADESGLFTMAQVYRIYAEMKAKVKAA